MAIRPTYSEKSRVVQSMAKGPSGSTTGPGTLVDDQIEQRPDVARGRRGSCEANPALPEAKM